MSAKFPKLNLKIVALGLLAALSMAVLNFSIFVTADLAEWKQVDYVRVFALEVTGAFSLLLLFPVMLWSMLRFPLDRSNWPRRLPLHLAMTVLVGTCHTLLMWGSRIVMYRVVGWGEFDYGRMSYRFPMEYGKQFMGYWFIFAVVSAIVHARQSRERELQASSLQAKLVEARLDALKMQLNPHFLFNTLNMISSYIYEDPAIADRMITRLSDLLRLTLDHADRQEVELEKELELLDGYLSIMQARFQEKMQVQLEIDPAARKCLVPFLILQPLVENSIKHCSAAVGDPGTIRVVASRLPDSVRLSVEDRGPGLPHDRESAGSNQRNGIGLANTRQRLEQLYGARHRFEMSNVENGGLLVVIEIPDRPGKGEAADE